MPEKWRGEADDDVDPWHNPEPGQVRFKLEVWPHEPGLNGESYTSGCMPADQVAAILRREADFIERYWSLPSIETRRAILPGPTSEQLAEKIARHSGRPHGLPDVFGDPCSKCGQDGWPAGSQGFAKKIHERSCAGEGSG